MFDAYDKPILNGVLQTPYQQIALTLQPSEIRKIDIAHSYFRALTISGSGLEVRFGGSGSFSSLIGAGIGIDLIQAVENMEVRNTSGVAISMVFAFSMGRITDDRLNVSGDVSIVNGSTPLLVSQSATNYLFAQSVITGINFSATTTLNTSNVNNVSCIIQNTGNCAIAFANTNNVANLQAQGFVLSPFEEFKYDGNSSLWAVTLTSGQTGIARILQMRRP